MPSAYKPSPLGYGSPRSSPFRRAESPGSPTPIRQTTPNTSPTKTGASYAPTRLATTPGPPDTPESRTPRGYSQGNTTMPPISPRLGSPAHLSAPRPAPARMQSASGNALSQLQPAQVRTLRDAFQILDRDSDGVVNREDVADMLGQLGTIDTYPLFSTSIGYFSRPLTIISSYRPPSKSLRPLTVLPTGRAPNNDPSRIPQQHRGLPRVDVAERRAAIGPLGLRRRRQRPGGPRRAPRSTIAHAARGAGTGTLDARRGGQDRPRLQRPSRLQQARRRCYEQRRGSARRGVPVP